MTFAAILFAAGSPRRVEIHTTLDEGCRQGFWSWNPAACAGRAVADSRPPPGPRPGGCDPHALMRGGTGKRSCLLVV